MCVKKDVLVQNQVGLHARPATFFIQKANEFKSSIWVEKDERRVNAKSLLGVLSLGIVGGTTIRIIADGADEQAAVDGLIKLVDIAPEEPGALEFIAACHDEVRISIAHTCTSYDTANAAFDAGATHMTHLYNAMPPIHHRNPGVIPAAVETPGVQAEIICDGYHIHPASVRLAFTMFRDRMVLISDSGRCAGEPEGTKFQLGGQDAWLRGGVAKLADGTIACSATNLWTCLQNVLKWNVPEEEAIRAATFNPAKAIGAADKVGTIETGKLADFVVTNADYTQKRVFIGGKEI